MKDLSIFTTEELEDLLKLTCSSERHWDRMLSKMKGSQNLGDQIYSDILTKKISKYQRFSKMFYDELEKREREREQAKWLIYNKFSHTMQRYQKSYKWRNMWDD